jgi:hypothetical protein
MGFSPINPSRINMGNKDKAKRDIPESGCPSTMRDNIIRILPAVYKLYSIGSFRQPMTSMEMKSVAINKFNMSMKEAWPEAVVRRAYQYDSHGRTR